MSFSKLGDDLMKVPKLDASGTNWVIYKDRFLWAVDARGLLDHVDGSGWEPRRPPVMMTRVTGANGIEKDEETPDNDDEIRLLQWQEQVKMWKRGEAVIKQQIAATIPDSLFIKIRGKGSASEIWEALTSNFQNKS